ncbi:TSR4 (YOL022C) [Zygosaccharomyces parabailii]|uniref:ZYBA0S13-01266g1_1 n=1 Tax=Zygosaccharomyces bailii (strain CLIB 213 / ATCC 58445 / CBS 680 / BCRC 21525 / NBRC 1098 / NCYC 1416 / NRRL Y-2227) TaxID=1333698 RepID=A0A8J2TAT8_ZYGB2|nr:TSR4 (YOL022C) [Zygosaccharomyces parabailii]CDF91687.1 ZYBA0S13-01266g1_1 [Zygosaccharomyces bailii CLIB 213]CDH16796.1 probable 20S rRNA accumulation protein 4 [Zygosaccharomyces bailii ISA1307]SJM87650.1 probable 20S rRNA accumulation protein 4 [Zygosaccharomyces bailii]
MSLSGSDLEDENYSAKQSQVCLGLVDTPVKEGDEITIEDTFIGGEPKWLHPESRPDDSLLLCGACKSSTHMRLLLQAFAPLDYDLMEELQRRNGLHNMAYVNPDDDRVLYVFICTKCQRKANSVRCIRGVKKSQPATGAQRISNKMTDISSEKKPQSNPFEVSTDSENNPFSGNPFAQKSTENPFAPPTSTSSGSAVDDKQQQPPQGQQISSKTSRKMHDNLKDKDYDASQAFKSYLLYVEEESFKNKKPDHLKLPKNLKIDKNALELTGESESALEKDPIKMDPRTEKLSKFLDDETFQKFQEIVGYNPGQVLRYELGGKPLLYAETKVDLLATVASPGYNPSSKRVFELQLMPKMILDLEEKISLENSMEWGTIMVFTDLENYVPQFDDNNIGYVQEAVKIQWESSTS